MHITSAPHYATNIQIDHRINAHGLDCVQDVCVCVCECVCYQTFEDIVCLPVTHKLIGTVFFEIDSKTANQSGFVDFMCIVWFISAIKQNQKAFRTLALSLTHTHTHTPPSFHTVWIHHLHFYSENTKANGNPFVIHSSLWMYAVFLEDKFIPKARKPIQL